MASIAEAIKHQRKVCIFHALEDELPFKLLVAANLNVSVPDAKNALNAMEASRWRVGDLASTLPQPAWLQQVKCVWVPNETCYCDMAVLTQDAFEVSQTGKYSHGTDRHCNKLGCEPQNP